MRNLSKALILLVFVALAGCHGPNLKYSVGDKVVVGHGLKGLIMQVDRSLIPSHRPYTVMLAGFNGLMINYTEKQLRLIK